MPATAKFRRRWPTILLLTLALLQFLAGAYFAILFWAQSHRAVPRTSDRSFITTRELVAAGHLHLADTGDAQDIVSRRYAENAVSEGKRYIRLGYATSITMISFGMVTLTLLIAQRLSASNKQTIPDE